MELILFASLYQPKEVLNFYTHFFIEELSIYVPGGVALRSLYIKKASAAEKFRGLTTLSGAALRARLRKAESYI